MAAPERALRWYFQGDQVSIEWTDGSDLTSWEVRDYYGSVVRAGQNPISPLVLDDMPVGWYKLYLIRGTSAGDTYVNSGGEACFIISRKGYGLQDAPLPRSAISGGGSAIVTVPATHAYIGTGSYRIDARIHPTDPQRWRSDLDKAVVKAADCLAYGDLGEPGENKRVVFASITDGTGGSTPSPEATAQLTTTVQELVAAGVTWFEGQNEPMGYSGATVAAHYAAFAATVHAAHPDAKVMGPCPVSVTTAEDGSGPPWLRAFLAAGGGDHIDGLSFHPYNAVENDLVLGRRNYSALDQMLTEFGIQDKPRFMTEYGTFASVYGSFEPHWQAQVVMLDWHLLWQIAGVHRNRTSYFYDLSHGFWAYPSWLIASSGGRTNPNPLALMLRTWVEETWGMDLTEALTFGPVEDRHYVGSRFARTTDGAQTLTFQSAGRRGQVTLSVSGTTTLEVVDCFGAIQTVDVLDGQAVIDLGPEPLHVRAPSGVLVNVSPTDFGDDVTPRGGMTIRALTGGSGPEKAADGNPLTQWDATYGDAGPTWWRADFDSHLTFDTVEVIAPPPWQRDCGLLDFDIHALINGAWVVIHTEQVPVVSLPWTSDSSAGGSWVDSYWDRRRIFVARLASPVTASAVRIYARTLSFGGGATIDQARTLRKLDSEGRGTLIGQAGRKRMSLQEVTLYLSP